MVDLRTHAHRGLVLLSLVLVQTLSPGVARASKSYPLAMKVELGLDAEPKCTVCHTTDDGGYKTVTRGFGRALVRLGLIEKSDPSLRTTLAKAEGIDTDNDTVPDLDELREGRDPNVPQALGDGGLPPPPPEQPPVLKTGCSVGDRRGGVPGVVAWIALLVVACAFRGRASNTRQWSP